MEGRPVGYFQAWPTSWIRVFEKQLQLSSQSGRDLNLWPPDFKSGAPKTWPHYHSPPPLLLLVVSFFFLLSVLWINAKKAIVLLSMLLLTSLPVFFCFCFCSIADQIWMRDHKKEKISNPGKFYSHNFFFFTKKCSLLKEYM